VVSGRNLGGGAWTGTLANDPLTKPLGPEDEPKGWIFPSGRCQEALQALLRGCASDTAAVFFTPTRLFCYLQASYVSLFCVPSHFSPATWRNAFDKSGLFHHQKGLEVRELRNAATVMFTYCFLSKLQWTIKILTSFYLLSTFIQVLVLISLQTFFSSKSFELRCVCV
jgi:hypothetical protein